MLALRRQNVGLRTAKGPCRPMVPVVRAKNGIFVRKNGISAPVDLRAIGRAHGGVAARKSPYGKELDEFIGHSQTVEGNGPLWQIGFSGKRVHLRRFPLGAPAPRAAYAAVYEYNVRGARRGMRMERAPGGAAVIGLCSTWGAGVGQSPTYSPSRCRLVPFACCPTFFPSATRDYRPIKRCQL